MHDLPYGSNKNQAWAKLVVPNFIRLIMAGDHPWFISDETIISTLQKVWKFVYGQSIPFEIQKGTVPFELVCLFLVIYALTQFSLGPTKAL
jgi:hypothetical protein